MPRRREFTGIAHAILGSFISRNNDIEGYWAFGRLCQHAQAEGVTTITLDALDASQAPPSAGFAPLVAEFRGMLLQQLAGHSIPVEWLHSARILIEFAVAPDATQLVAFACRVLLEDDFGNVRQAVTSAHCWPTTPAREYRRICDDWNRRGRKPASPDHPQTT